MKFVPYFTASSEKVVIAISLARIYVNNVALISVDMCLVHSDKLRACVYAASVVLTGNSMGSSEIWDKYHSCCIGNGKFPIQLILVVFIPNFTATHAITSTNRDVVTSHANVY